MLRLRNRELLMNLSTFEENQEDFKTIVETSRAGIPTLKLDIDGKTQYIHSKYDPEKEAERLMSQLENIGNSKHILFVGSGLGYHIQRFTEQYPTMKFSIYEPNEEVLVSYLSNRKLNDLPLSNLGTIFTGSDEAKLHQEIAALLQSSNSQLRIYTLPVYESLYGDQIKVILQKALVSLKDKQSVLVTNLSFQKRWTVNSIKNFPTVLKTPNILHDIDRSAFEGKPAIIVAAGPSLNGEFENLRYIKENGLAYIFSVGSAINALIENGIYPDATCTYDPSERNQFVIQKIKDKKITNIPLVFGSSVGFETLEKYPGKMLHMITSQDTISPHLLDTKESIGIVLDAPSIAVVTLQLLTKLGCNPIMLVGQNLGYQDNKRYALGIEYDFVENELNETEKEVSLTVKDVYGNDIQTSDGFNRMRLQLEMHIGANKGIEVINTTKGGAQIEGTSFAHLDKLINERLKSKVVDYKWTEELNSYNMEYVKKQVDKISSAEKNCNKILQNTLDELKLIREAVEKKQTKNMNDRFASLDKEFFKLKINPFYHGFVEPMIRVQNEQLSEASQSIRYKTDILEKAEVIINSFNIFIQEVHLHMEFAKPYFEELKEQIENG
ncbi:MAG TPA: DUF115 domain-containing protein [Sporosarcina psychrophila]|uniref:DUF115 domain-containing protein n=1 Tax=Sporosarcina psychrophila TaxID=1476 RepID=A0A921FYY8_SPOPS|nr:DUF115 domain-containing protein [Sporosarcina psychrophila]